ncbi:DinB family protein [Paenibacillus arenilitoris]|uniref:DinB family protein n=1 Tax=Paenibacillus arenilitoris TaxID=2772299 RepID=A0A927H555_9BACL|nr:DinB family protein [Paenibacillus arenilitoris]MBD2867199.1 DinB family protein [Paenibacillus arenilitoris]
MYLRKPSEGEFVPANGIYIDAAPEGDPAALLLEQEREIVELYGKLDEEQSLFRYGVGKWSLKEALGHIMDTERIMSYRLLCAARGDATPLPRHADVFVDLTDFDSRPLAELIAEFRAVRASTVSLVRGLTGEELQRFGFVNDSPTTAAALAYFIIGHALHHLRIVRERYLPSM